MSRVRRAITVFFFFFFIERERECMPVESPSFSPNPGGVWGGGRVAGRVDVQARVVYVSE